VPTPVSSAAATLLPVPAPTASPVASLPEIEPVAPPPTDAVPPTAASIAAPVVAAVPDRVDRSWPRNPPWDACPRPIWPGEHSVGLPGSGRRVLVVGDSLTRDSRVLTARGMHAAGWTPSFRCWGSRRLDWGIDQVVRARGLRELPEFVIVALGTNDISWETQATTERRVRSLLDRLGPDRQVLWVDLHLTRSAWLDARAAWFNELLRRIERQRPNLTVVAWHRVARAHGIHGWDGIHYGPYGYRLRAQTVLAALNAVGRANPAPTLQTASVSAE
jgi:lysophospholipase L1-like esterase